MQTLIKESALLRKFLLFLLCVAFVLGLFFSINRAYREENDGDESETKLSCAESGYIPLSKYIKNEKYPFIDDEEYKYSESAVSFFVRSDNFTNHLYGFVPWTLISGSCKCNEASKYLLYTEQLTNGVGLRDIFWDQGTILTQDIVFFELDSTGSLTSGCNKKLHLKAPELKYRDSLMLDKSGGATKKSFASSLLWSFDVREELSSGVFVSLSDFALHAVGTSHRNSDLNSIIRKEFGSQYSYVTDKAASVINVRQSKATSYSSSIESEIAYSLAPNSASSTPPRELDDVLPFGSSLIISVRKTLLNLKKFDSMHKCSCCDCCDDEGPTEKPLAFIKHNPFNTEAISDGKAGKTVEAVKSEESESYRVRPFHPKSGFNRISFMNDKQPLYGPRQKQYITRHNIVHLNTSSAVAVKPQIVFVVSKDTPAVVKDALREGIQWWDNAFQYAGISAFNPEIDLNFKIDTP